MSRKYHSLLEKLPGESWAVQFGDYDRAVVQQEVQDMKESGSHVKGTKYTIITTSGHQSIIDEAIAQLNAKDSK